MKQINKKIKEFSPILILNVFSLSKVLHDRNTQRDGKTVDNDLHESYRRKF